MHAHGYTRERAERLVPMLRSIRSEIGERTRAIERLEGFLASTKSQSGRRPASMPPRGVDASLAHQRRELRLAKQELARFGCTLDSEQRILIPGEDGTIESGFAWSPTDEGLSQSTPQPVR